jgi:protein-disulfide isomerase
MTRRRSLLVAAALSAAGLVLALVLARQHAQAHAGVESFCAINDFVNCDRVATSRFSVVLGLPVAVWGALAYGLALLLALVGLRERRPHPAWPAGLLLLLAAGAVAAAVALALVSELAIGALCLLCAASWLVSAALLAAAFGATRPEGAAASVRADLGLLAARPARSAGLALAAAAVVALVAAAYPRYWEHPPRAAAAPARPPATTQAARPPLPAPAAAPAAASRVVVSFSDYECPFCALAHEEAKEALASRPDVTVVRKHFPLDPACNPAVPRAMHPSACLLASAAICAEEQGKLDAMDDALFENQKARLPLDRIVARLGLDASRFGECLRAPSTHRRLQADVAAGLAVGVRATPTWVVNGVAHSGKLPVELLPPPP